MHDYAGIEMPKYRCHKTVWAFKIKSITRHNADDPNAEADCGAWRNEARQGRKDGFGHHIDTPKESGAVRRSSMDLTRSLANLRRYS